jgi:hypothetical protein
LLVAYPHDRRSTNVSCRRQELEGVGSEVDQMPVIAEA